MIDEDGFFTNHFNFLPADDDIVLVPHKAHTFRAAMDDDGKQLRRAGVDFHIVHTADARAVAYVDDLFIVHIGDSAKHIEQSPFLWWKSGRLANRSAVIEICVVLLHIYAGSSADIPFVWHRLV